MEDLEHTVMEDVTIKTETPWHTVSDSSLKVEDSKQAYNTK